MDKNRIEIETPLGTYVMENRIGAWMAWGPDSCDPFYIDYSRDLVKLIMETRIRRDCETKGIEWDSRNPYQVKGETK
jgi:hypothetical protein